MLTPIHPPPSLHPLFSSNLKPPQAMGSAQHAPGPPPWRPSSAARSLAMVILLVCVWWICPPGPGPWNRRDRAPGSGSGSGSDDEAVWSWDLIPPSAALEYHDCFDRFQCARLQVPIDYHRNASQGGVFSIALARLPAKVPVTDARYGGPILINPGGPGGSGVFQALVVAHHFQSIIDDEAGKSYDIIGFDPRGVNNTTPGFSCFPDIFSQKNWELQAQADGILGSSRDSFTRNWQRAMALNPGCSRDLLRPRQPDTDAIGEHMNTVPVARDMLEIIERHAEWRDKQGLAEQQRRDREIGYDATQSVARRTRWHRGEEKLLFWGRSYGTVLGSTFATLFPDRVGRLVLDGVVDTDKYYRGEGHNPIIDADAIFDKFLRYCDLAGPGACPLYTEGGPNAIQNAYRTLEASLYEASLPVPASPRRGPELITWTDLKDIVRIAMYQPLTGFPMLGRFTAELLQGNGSSVADFKQLRRTPSCPSTECVRDGPWSDSCRMPGQNEAYATAAILCADASYLQEVDADTFHVGWQKMKQDSVMLGDYWSGMELGCVGWKVRPRWTLPGGCGGNTSHPLLFVSNVLDPVTPLKSALKMSGKFPESAVLQVDSEGHTTMAAPSSCARQYIRQYFQTGALPEAGTVCEPDVRPLLGRVEAEEYLMQYSYPL